MQQLQRTFDIGGKSVTFKDLTAADLAALKAMDRTEAVDHYGILRCVVESWELDGDPALESTYDRTSIVVLASLAHALSAYKDEIARYRATAGLNRHQRRSWLKLHR